MPNCPAEEEVYLAESRLEDCLTNDNLLRAWRQSSSEYVNVSGGLETGGGIAIEKSLLPHLQLEEDETLVLTASHIVANGRPTLLGTYDKEGQLQDLYQGQVVFADASADLALVKVKIKDRNQRPRAINYYDLRDARAGEAAIAIQPEDEERNIGVFTVNGNSTYGSIGGAAIRAQNSQIVVADETTITLLNQPDLDGTSGSPVVASDGKILGIVSQRITIPRSDSVARTVAISADQIRRFLRTANIEASIPRAHKL